ncbi:MAG: FAD-dependent oxidoreductase [Tissierellaceae bacterium]
MNTKKSDEFKLINQKPKSYWTASTDDTDYPRLDQDTEVDVAIVGGGIVGIATAYQLQSSGMKIAILEGDRIARGTTGHTTGKITSQHNLIYGKLIRDFGKNQAQQYAAANELAIKEIKRIADENKIDCDYSSQSAYVYTQDETYLQQIKEEVEAAKSLGIEATYVEEIPFSMSIKGGVRFDNQAQFHPRKFLLPIAAIVHKAGVEIYEQSRIVKLDEKEDGRYLLTTDKNYSVTAKIVIIASHYPFYNKLGAYFARISQSRTYAIAIKAKEKFPDGVFINAEYPNRSLRSISTESGEYILLVGDSHETGHGHDTNIHYQALADFADSLFTVEDIPYRWSTQDCIAIDGIPYIGRFSQETPNLYLATAFGKWGISNGLVSSVLLRDLIVNGSSPWEEVYNPSRNKNISAIEETKKQSQRANESLGRAEGEKPLTPTDVKKGEGKIIEVDGKKVGAYRDEGGGLHFVNPICAHMGCQVNWNPAERSWDCPCHGSRYDIDGNVINGPAVNPLSFQKDTNIIDRLTKEDF